MADDGSFDTSYASGGAGIGAGIGGTLGSFAGPAGSLVGGTAGAIIGGTAGLALGGVKYLLGSAQRKQAKSIHPYDPGYQGNPDVIDNARVQGDVYNNYQLPGYQQMLANLTNAGAVSQTNAQRGATSSADVISAANTGNQIQAQQLGGLAVQNAQGKQSALSQYLAAKAAAGAEQENQNVYEREMYNQQLQLKNQLNNNATANQYGAADQAGKLISSIFAYRGGINNNKTGKIKQGAPIFGDGLSSGDNSNIGDFA